MRAHLMTSLASIIALLAAACSSSDSTTPRGGTPAAAVELEPAQGNRLTCTGKVTATVTDASPGVTWSTVPTGLGGADASDAWTAPNQTPAPARFTLTATSSAEPAAKASGSFTLATAFPSAITAIPSATTESPQSSLGGAYVHAAAARGQRVYTTWLSGDGAHAVELHAVRSDDAGKTWNAPVTALHATTPEDAQAPEIGCASVAIDAENPDVVYVAADVSTWGNSVADSVLPGSGAGGTTALLVSEDGGATFTTRVLKVTNAGPGICPDLVSPAADTVVVSVPDPFDNPGHYQGGGTGIGIWSDAARGAGFADGTGEDLDYSSNGETGALLNIGASTNVQEGSAGGGSGGEWESPRLFTDGKGKLCITYTAWIDDDGATADDTSAYVACSTDAGHTFTAPKKLESEGAAYAAVGAIDDAGEVDVGWVAVADAARHVTLALSHDGGQTFGTPFEPPFPANLDLGKFTGETWSPSLAFDAQGILWLGYYVNDGQFYDRIFVDKSCDHGTTWSGAVLVNGPVDSPAIDLTKPTFVLTDGAIGVSRRRRGSADRARTARGRRSAPRAVPPRAAARAVCDLEWPPRARAARRRSSA